MSCERAIAMGAVFHLMVNYISLAAQWVVITLPWLLLDVSLGLVSQMP